MPRVKLIREYAIRLVHPILGIYYYNYTNYNWYNGGSWFMFTQDLSKVSKRKNIKSLEKQISQITESDLSSDVSFEIHSDKILLPLGKELKENLDPEIKNKIFHHRNRYYYSIDNIVSKYHIDKAENDFNESNKILSSNIKSIVDMFNDSEYLNDDFIKTIKSLEYNVNVCRDNYNFLKETKKTSKQAQLDIIDASFNFRYLKLKTLGKIKNDAHQEDVDQESVKI